MKLKYILVNACLAVTITGCLDALDKKDLSAVTEEDVWNDPNYTKAYLNKLYNDNLPGWDAGIAGNSDEATGESAILYGQLTTSSIDNWPYTQIRNINILLSSIEQGEIDVATKELLKAQALVLRAWRYFTMVRLYGGVPMIMEPQKLTDDLYVSREKTSKSIELILKDLDVAFESLPWVWTGDDSGRFTKATVMALKGRILLYYASPQFNPQNDPVRWTIAYEYNKKAVEEIEKNGYGLYESYSDLWFDEMNKEVLFVKRYQEPNLTHPWDAYTRPLSEAQNYAGGNQPTLEMVQSYPMIDGKSIENHPDFGPIYYWKNRDPRFEATIAHNGVLWELSGKAGRKQWNYIGYTALNPTSTGFYCKKAINVSYTPYYTERSSTDWIEIRFAEVLMNYAECAVEVGKMDEAYDVLKRIRNRAGILPGNNNLYGLKENMSHDEMVNTIMSERKIEFAYEGKRYWDLRRRRMFAFELNGTRRHGLLPKLKISHEDFNEIADQFDLNSQYDTYFKDSVVVLDQKFPINFQDNYYFYAIPLKHIETNSKLEQTSGWDNGTFNPYE